jgi:hypothetical protein
MKNPKPLKNAHTPNTKFGMGDYYGTGIKAKVGRIRENFMEIIPQIPKKIKTAPKSLA